jgi:D-glycerate 3-kinase
MQPELLRRALLDVVDDPRRVDRYYAPLAAGCLTRLERCARRPWVMGLEGAQGSGKTTVATAVTRALCAVGVRATTVSIDDFYLTSGEQEALAARHPGNPYLRFRGYPGTHDVDLGTRTIEAIASLGAGDETRVPRYDKGARGGRGDRAPSSAWTAVTGPVDVLVVEGWMLGFSPVEPSSVDELLRVPNALLGAYAAWHRELDAFVRLDVARLDTIVAWRVDSERRRREAGESALSDDDARDYIERFLPAYRAYLPGLRSHPPCADVRAIALGEDRMPVADVPA